MKKVMWSDLTSAERLEILKRPVMKLNSDFKNKVEDIIQQVRVEGDKALYSFTEKFDGVKLSSLFVNPDEVKEAYEIVSDEGLKALKEAIRRVSLFHEKQKPQSYTVETSPGVKCQRVYLPIENVGLYVPGGTATLPSTVVMLAVPSLIAGCSVRTLATPPRADGKVDPYILVAADLLQIKTILKVGGAQAIAALAFGTESVSKVDKIFGPGNSWVTEAKIQVANLSGGAALDMPAGPSEVLVVADQLSNPYFVASDLLSQAEHGPDSQVVLVTKNLNVEAELEVLLSKLPRENVAREALSKSVVVKVETDTEIVEVINQYAPEHLILQIENYSELLPQIKNAGSIFLGPWTPESVGDYASGTNHVLPTYGHAKAFGGLTVESFMKSMTIQELSPKGLLELGPVVETLASIEKLEAHKLAVSIRLVELRK